MKKSPWIVSVSWVDAHSTDEWSMPDELPKEGKACVSVGFLIAKTKDVISIAGTGSEDGDVCCTIHVPRGWVKGMRYLTRLKK